jgi:hypothetical protein
MAPLYEALHDYIEHQHETAMSQRRSSSSSCTLGAQRLPAAVVAAAGLNAADYVTTFQDLKEHLKSLDVSCCTTSWPTLQCGAIHLMNSHACQMLAHVVPT